MHVLTPKECYASSKSLFFVMHCMEFLNAKRVLAAVTDNGGERRRMMELGHAAFGSGDLTEYRKVLEHYKWPWLCNISLGQNICLNSQYPSIH